MNVNNLDENKKQTKINIRDQCDTSRLMRIMNMINLSLVFAAFHGVRIYNRYFIYSTTVTPTRTIKTGKSVQRGCIWKYYFTKPHPFIQYLK